MNPIAILISTILSLRTKDEVTATAAERLLTLAATPEAMIVSSADELDFRMFCWQDAVKDLTDEQPISQWNFSAQRRFWKR